nr:O-methyltransferase [Xylaria schweinitzii]
MSFNEAREKFLKTVTIAPALGFVPIAVEFCLFDRLCEIGRPATAQDICKAHGERDGRNMNLSLQLTDDTLLMMGGIGFLDIVSNGMYQANDVTEFLATTPSSQHGAVHFTSEILLASAFLMKRLVETDFVYPFQECQTPLQYAYKCMGSTYAQEHTYSIMHKTGRLDSFNAFMDGKFGDEENIATRLNNIGYDMSSLITDSLDSKQPTVLVDIAGGRGKRLLELKDAFPRLGADNLVLQEYNSEIGEVPGVTQMSWNFKDEDQEQPVKGALIYFLCCVLHNLSDVEVVKLFKKVRDAMSSRSRILIKEPVKNTASSTTHGAMIVLYGGRERTSAEWQNLAAGAGLMVAFEVYPQVGECVVEMRIARV